MGQGDDGSGGTAQLAANAARAARGRTRKMMRNLAHLLTLARRRRGAGVGVRSCRWALGREPRARVRGEAWRRHGRWPSTHSAGSLRQRRERCVKATGNIASLFLARTGGMPADGRRPRAAAGGRVGTPAPCPRGKPSAGTRPPPLPRCRGFTRGSRARIPPIPPPLVPRVPGAAGTGRRRHGARFALGGGRTCSRAARHAGARPVSCRSPPEHHTRRRPSRPPEWRARARTRAAGPVCASPAAPCLAARGL